MRIVVGFFLFFGFSASALAVPPPDFLFNVGSQLAQIFAVVAIFLSAVFGTVWQYARASFAGFRTFKHRKLVILSALLFILAASLAIAWWYQQYQQQKAYAEWVHQSRMNTEVVPDSAPMVSPQKNTIQPVQTNHPESLKDIPTALSNQEFQKLIENKTALFVLDARETEEFDLGHFPGSVHFRFADLFVDDWKELPNDNIIYAFCWSGIRGKEVADFLRSKGLKARYLEEGANGWVKNGGVWEGEIAFSSKYEGEQYTRLFTKEEIQKQLKSGTVLIDTRKKEKYERHHISESLNIPIIYTPSNQIEALLAAVPKNKPVITVCDDFVSCFDAKITGIRLEARGHVFLGRYNKPWEF